MPTSQFTIYSSTDVGGPGYLNGRTGSLITVLDACLVNGYSGKPAAGWSKPFATTSSVSTYKQGSGSRFTVLINDSGPNATPLGKEAWATGWEYLSASTAPVGTGSGQFPLPAQLLTTGHTVIRKSASADSVLRPWVLYADASTFYLFVVTGDSSGYYMFMFGDIYSLSGSSDLYRCMIIGRQIEDNGASQYADLLNPYMTATNLLGHFIARTAGGGGAGSTVVSKIADKSREASGINSNYAIGACSLPCPNPTDNAIYIGPIWIVENSAYLRGRLRGMYCACHAVSNFADGQCFQGSNQYAGKSFKVVKPSETSGMFVMETSATVETN
jgi:hypothetical protein